MRLQICEALVGTPVNGDAVRIELEDGRVLGLTYVSHPIWKDHVWLVRENDGWPIELLDFGQNAQSAISFEAYLEPGTLVALQQKLHMELAPRANSTLRMNASTEQRVVSIELL